jgi:hypothetical protein
LKPQKSKEMLGRFEVPNDKSNMVKSFDHFPRASLSQMGQPWPPRSKK